MSASLPSIKTLQPINNIKKIVVIGPESTGKSTLSEALATALQTVWVREYAVEYLDGLSRAYEERDLLEIAKGQLASEDASIAQANKYLVCDTDLNVLKVWSEHKYGRCDKWILEQIAARRYDLYLLTAPDIPWAYHPQREHPDAEMREYFYRVYKDIVVESGVPLVAVSGSYEKRLQEAIAAVGV